MVMLCYYPIPYYRTWRNLRHCVLLMPYLRTFVRMFAICSFLMRNNSSLRNLLIPLGVPIGLFFVPDFPDILPILLT